MEKEIRREQGKETAMGVEPKNLLEKALCPTKACIEKKGGGTYA